MRTIVGEPFRRRLHTARPFDEAELDRLRAAWSVRPEEAIIAFRLCAGASWRTVAHANCLTAAATALDVMSMPDIGEGRVMDDLFTLLEKTEGSEACVLLRQRLLRALDKARGLVPAMPHPGNMATVTVLFHGK